MKEILKYLRQLHSFTQEEVAQQLGLSRQSYIKYEKGLVEPSCKVVNQLAGLYHVSEDFIYNNEIPGLPTENSSRQPSVRKDSLYHTEPGFGQCLVADDGSAGTYMEGMKNSSLAGKKQPKTYQAYFDGTAIRVLTDEVLQAGQKFVLVEVADDEAERKRKAKETIRKYAGSLSSFSDKEPDDDPYYKGALYEALDEKYGSIS